MTGPATKMHEALRDVAVEAEADEARRIASVAVRGITPAQLNAMDAAADLRVQEWPEGLR